MFCIKICFVKNSKHAIILLMKSKGFTVLEIVIALAIAALFTFIAIPYAHNTYINQQKEQVLKTLNLMRDAIKLYAKDHNGKYPRRLVRLVEEDYLRTIPLNPITDQADWQIARRTYENYAYEPGKTMLKLSEEWVKNGTVWADKDFYLPVNPYSLGPGTDETPSAGNPVYASYWGVCNVRSSNGIGIDPEEDRYGTVVNVTNAGAYTN
jgi:general secretion pathway protein G